MNINEGTPALLSTVWIHPLYRRQGKFKDLWLELKHIYGDFEVEQPNSSMKAFMSAMGEAPNTELAASGKEACWTQR